MPKNMRYGLMKEKKIKKNENIENQSHKKTKDIDLEA